MFVALDQQKNGIGKGCITTWVQNRELNSLVTV